MPGLSFFFYTEDGRHGLYSFCISEGAKYILFFVYEEQMASFIRVYVSYPVGEEYTSIGEALKATQKLEGFAGDVFVREFPHGIAFLIEFYQTGVLRFVGYSDQGMPIGQTDDGMGAAGYASLPDYLPFGVVFFHGFVAVMGYQVVAVVQLAGITHKGECAVGNAFGQDVDLLHDLSFGGDFEQTTGITFAYKGVSVLQALTGEDGAFGGVAEEGIAGLGIHFEYAFASGEEQVATG